MFSESSTHTHTHTHTLSLSIIVIYSYSIYIHTVILQHVFTRNYIKTISFVACIITKLAGTERLRLRGCLLKGKSRRSLGAPFLQFCHTLALFWRFSQPLLETLLRCCASSLLFHSVRAICQSSWTQERRRLIRIGAIRSVRLDRFKEKHTQT